MSDREHDRWREDLAAYVLGALPPADAGPLEAHLEACERCRAELGWLRPAVDALPAEVEQHRPSGRLRRRVLGEVRADAARQSGRSVRRRAPALRPAFGIAAAVGIVAVGVVGYSLRGSGVERTSSPLQASAGAPPGAAGDLVRYGGSATLEMSGLPAVHGGDVYEAWIRSGQSIQPSTVFVPAHDGTAAAGIPDVGQGETLMITREPHGGSSHPSSAPIFTVPLS